MVRKDPAWKWAKEMDGPKPNVTYCRCNFCEVLISGGVSRLKNHLAGTRFQVKACPKAPKEVKEEAAAMLKKTSTDRESRETMETERVDLGSHMDRLHAGGSSHGSVSARGQRGPMDLFVIEQDSQEGVTPTDTPRSTVTVSELKKAVWQDIGRFFYENCIPFHVASSPSFVGMLRSIGNYGRGLTPPTAHDISGKLLEGEKKCTEASVEEIKKTWPSTGVSIISDGWKDIRGRQLINFLVNNPHGTVFLRTIDASDAIKTGEMLFKLLDEVVEEVGEQHVVQIITDNASNYVAAGRMLMEKRKTLWWTPCAAHCIDLMLEKIGDLPQHKNALRKAKKVTNYIYNHGWVLNLMRENCLKELVRPAATRFGTAYLTLESLLDLKTPLQCMFSSPKWSHSTYAKTGEGRLVKKIILDDGVFWPSVVYAIKTTKPLFYVLRMTDSEKIPAMGFLYGAMDRAKEQIKEALDNNLGSYNEIVNIIDSKWENQMNRPLHAAACFLNPRFQYDDNWKADVKVKLALYKALDRMLIDPTDRENAELQLDTFKYKREIFGSITAQSTAKKRAPAEWWEAYGDHCPELQAFAIKVLSLTCSSSASERNWSTFNQIHTKRRNRLSVDKMNSLAYVMYNRKLRERHIRKRSMKEDEEPLLAERLPSDDEWIAGLDDARPSRASRGREGPSQPIAAIESEETPRNTYSRKRKTPAGGSSSRDKGKRLLGAIEKEPNVPEWSEDDEVEEEADEAGATSGTDDSIGGEDDTEDASYDPSFRLPDSNNSMFNF